MPLWDVPYDKYSGTDPVSDAAGRVAEGTSGYVADSLNFDEASQFFVFEIQGERPETFEFAKRLGAARFGLSTFTTDSQPSTAEALKKSLSSRRSGR